MSGMPMIQFSLVSMLELVNEGIFTIEKVVEKMCHAPAQIYNIHNRGFIRPGYQADLVYCSSFKIDLLSAIGFVYLSVSIQ